MQSHTALATTALASMIILTGWSVIHSGAAFDPESFGIGAGALIFGGGTVGAGVIAARRWSRGSQAIDNPDAQ